MRKVTVAQMWLLTPPPGQSPRRLASAYSPSSLKIHRLNHHIYTPVTTLRVSEELGNPLWFREALRIATREAHLRFITAKSMEDYGTETESDYSSYWRDWVSERSILNKHSTNVLHAFVCWYSIDCCSHLSLKHSSWEMMSQGHCYLQTRVTQSQHSKVRMDLLRRNSRDKWACSSETPANIRRRTLCDCMHLS